MKFGFIKFYFRKIFVKDEVRTEYDKTIYSFWSSSWARNSLLVLATLACLAARPILAAFHLFLVTFFSTLLLGEGSLRMAAWH